MGFIVSAAFFNARGNTVDAQDVVAFETCVKSYIRDIKVDHVLYKNGELKIFVGLSAGKVALDSGIIALEACLGTMGIMDKSGWLKLLGVGFLAHAGYNMCELVGVILKSLKNPKVPFVTMNSEGIKFCHKPFARWEDIQGVETETTLFKKLMFNLNYDLELFSIKENDALCPIHFETLVLLVNHFYKQFGLP